MDFCWAAKQQGKYPPLSPTLRWIIVFSTYHTSWITRGPKSNFNCDNILAKAILFSLSCSEVNSTWLITSELANRRAWKVLFTCVVYTNLRYSPHLTIGQASSRFHLPSRKHCNFVDHTKPLHTSGWVCAMDQAIRLQHLYQFTNYWILLNAIISSCIRWNGCLICQLVFSVYCRLFICLLVYLFMLSFLQEKMKGKNKLVPRLLGVTKESILRVDEKTKEVCIHTMTC